MAEEKKEAEKPKSKGQKRYGSGPKIEKAPAKGDDNKSATTEEASAEAEKTADGETVEANMDSDPGPEGTEKAGTADIDVNGRHSTERKEMVARHETERHDMAKRHEKEHKKLGRRHMAELDGGKADAETEED